MRPSRKIVGIAVEKQTIGGTLLEPSMRLPGVLFVHGWGGSQTSDLALASDVATLGCLCLTFDLRGHAGTAAQFDTVTREDNLRDLQAAYDVLASHPDVEAGSIAIVGSSYGAYLAALLLKRRTVRWLVLRVPALYRDGEWDVPKRQLDRSALAAYRQMPISFQQNRALSACAGFAGDVLIVESERDELIPHETIMSYRGAFRRVRSLSYRVIEQADHALSDGVSQRAYSALLRSWMGEMVRGARSAPFDDRDEADATIVR